LPARANSEAEAKVGSIKFIVPLVPTGMSARAEAASIGNLAARAVAWGTSD
jgi:hypothetical protein